MFKVCKKGSCKKVVEESYVNVPSAAVKFTVKKSRYVFRELEKRKKKDPLQYKNKIKKSVKIVGDKHLVAPFC